MTYFLFSLPVLAHVEPETSQPNDSAEIPPQTITYLLGKPILSSPDMPSKEVVWSSLMKAYASDQEIKILPSELDAYTLTLHKNISLPLVRCMQFCRGGSLFDA